MGFGILEDKYLEHVPGTAVLLDEAAPRVAGDPKLLKHAKGAGDKGVVLIPQPSNDVNDTLNWTQRRKYGVMLCIVYASALVGAIGPVISPGLLVIAADLNVDLTSASQLSGALVEAIAVGTFFTAAGGTVYGSRPMYLIAAVVLFVTSIWCAAAKDFPSLLAARIIQGFGMAPIETLVPATLSDIFFTHERAKAMAVWSTALALGITVTPFINGVVINHLGWRWCFWLISIQFGIMLLILFLFVPETRYNRPEISNIDTGSHEKIAELTTGGLEPTVSEENQAKESGDDVVHLESQVPRSPPLKTFKQNLTIYTGRKSPKSFWHIFLRPFSVLLSPIVIWASLIYGTTSALFVVLSVLQAQIWSATPYHFNSQQIGYTGLGGLAFIWLGLVEGVVLDWIVKRMAHANGGIFEPEFRLVFIIPQIVLQVMGLVGWGISARNGDAYMVPVIFSTIFGLGQGFGSLASSVYVIDAHRERAAEAFTVITLYKNTLTLPSPGAFVNNWLAQQGMMGVMGVLAGLIAACSLTTIPMYRYGKRARSWVHRMGLDRE